MNILFLAPHPFYQERGTPIAVRLLLQTLARRGDQVDVLTYHEGKDVMLPGVTMLRIPRLPGIRGIRPGFSLKKLVCDLFFFIYAWRMARHKKYDLVHAVEESAFMAHLIQKHMGIPYVYDMDSCLSAQMADKSGLFRRLTPCLQKMEAGVFRNALAVVPVCEALAEIARAQGAQNVRVLHDISLLEVLSRWETVEDENLNLHGFVFMYIGNLEPYQGIDLLLESFATLHRTNPQARLVVVGGVQADIVRYQNLAQRLGIGEKTHFIGPRPPAMMPYLFRQADVLVSPRIHGVNTPMKVYSYLQAGKPLLATDLPTHTQVLNDRVAALAAPSPAEFARAMSALIQDAALRQKLADNALALANAQYSLPVFEQAVADLYQWLESQVVS